MERPANAMGVLAEHIPVGDGSEALDKPEEPLFRGHADRNPDYCFAAGCGREKLVGLRTNFNIKLVVVSR